MFELKRIDNLIWKVERHGNMHMPVLIFASESLLKKLKINLWRKLWLMFD